MGADICTKCSERVRDQEVIMQQDQKPIELLRSAAGSANLDDIRNEAVNEKGVRTNVETEERQKFWKIVKEQLTIGNSPNIKATEKKYGPFQFDDRQINDSVIKTVVGPKMLENGSTYYGHWYFVVIA